MLTILMLTAATVGTLAGILVTNVTNSGVAGLFAGVIVWAACISTATR